MKAAHNACLLAEVAGKGNGLHQFIFFRKFADNGFRTIGASVIDKKDFHVLPLEVGEGADGAVKNGNGLFLVKHRYD